MENHGQIGNVGSYDLVVNPNGTCTAQIGAKYPTTGTAALDVGAHVKLDIIEILKLAAKETSNGVDDIMVAMIAKAFGR